MCYEDLLQIELINQQLDHMKELGIIEDYSFNLGDSLESSKISLRVKEEMAPLLFKSGRAERTVH